MLVAAWRLAASNVKSDVGMVERRQRLRLTLEARQPLGIPASKSGRTLIATSRLSFVSRA
jgi:hypothetical protein